MEFQLGWYADPIFFGDYPASMKERVGNRLPNFTERQKTLLKGSYDFFALNHYTSAYAANPPSPNPNPQSWADDMSVILTRERDGKLIGPQAASDWLYVVPWGLNKMLQWVYNRYQTPIWITENGVDVPNENSIPLPEVLHDKFRISYFQSYIAAMVEAMKAGVEIKGYFAWSIMDNFEWADGYSKRFGLFYVDYKNGLTRYKKDSATWFSNFLHGSYNGSNKVEL